MSQSVLDGREFLYKKIPVDHHVLAFSNLEFSWLFLKVILVICLPLHRILLINTLQNSRYKVAYHPSWKLSKLDEPDMRDIAGEVRTCSLAIYSCGPLPMDEQRQDENNMQQLCADTGCSLEDLPVAMDDKDGWQEKVREIRAGSMTWWWSIKPFCYVFTLPIFYSRCVLIPLLPMVVLLLWIIHVLVYRIFITI